MVKSPAFPHFFMATFPELGWASSTWVSTPRMGYPKMMVTQKSDVKMGDLGVPHFRNPMGPWNPLV